MATISNGGPLSAADLANVWSKAVDPSYAQAFQAAGEGAGYEAYTQAFQQLARASSAIDASMQALYILPWSGQSGAPAAGPSLATVQLAFTRTGIMTEPLVLSAGTVFYLEQEPDWGPQQGVAAVQTGRRYTLQQNLVFQPGQQGPLVATAVAERPGWGYNNPKPGSINVAQQFGTGYANTGATLTGAVPSLITTVGAQQIITLTVADVPSVVIPQHVGQYVQLTAASGLLGTFRMLAYGPPIPPTSGGSVQLDYAICFSSLSGSTGTFIPGEIATVSSGPTVVGYLTVLGTGTVNGTFAGTFSFRTGLKNLNVGNVVTGNTSGATMTLSQTLNLASGLPPAGLVSWRVLDWVSDWGLTVTNAARPTGGVAPMLDALGKERGVSRTAGELDAVYRQRVAQIADVVTPNAIRRALNKTLTKPQGLTWCLREVGTSLLPGFFLDLDAFDYDFTQPAGGVVTGVFQNGEKVTQVTGGVVTFARALIQQGIPAVPFVPGAAGTTGNPTLSGIQGFGNVRGTFVVGTTITGLTSKATWASNSGITGGLSNAVRWKILLDYLRFRGYFAVEVQRSDIADCGFGWGTGNAPGTGALVDAWDTGPQWNDFLDGTPVGSNALYLNARGAVNAARAAGVTFEFIPAAGPCV